MQYLLTNDEQIRLQVTAAITEAEGLGKIVATDSLERLRESLNTGDVSCILVDEALTDASALATVQELSLVPIRSSRSFCSPAAEAPKFSLPPWTQEHGRCSHCHSLWKS